VAAPAIFMELSEVREWSKQPLAAGKNMDFKGICNFSGELGRLVA
jgi:hypothetical protein